MTTQHGKYQHPFLGDIRSALLQVSTMNTQKWYCSQGIKNKLTLKQKNIFVLQSFKIKLISALRGRSSSTPCRVFIIHTLL